MARLYAHGAEMFRMRKTTTAESGDTRYTVYAFMADGKVLRKQGWTSAKTEHAWESTRGDSGWKLPDLKPEYREQSRLLEFLIAKGYERET